MTTTTTFVQNTVSFISKNDPQNSIEQIIADYVDNNICKTEIESWFSHLLEMTNIDDAGDAILEMIDVEEIDDGYEVTISSDNDIPSAVASLLTEKLNIRRFFYSNQGVVTNLS